MSVPNVEVLVAVHDPARPLARALASADADRDALAAMGAELALSVVVHNTDPAPIQAAVPPALRARVRWSHHIDGIASPAGPNNLALDQAEGEYVAKLDSDDVFEPGTLAAWYARAREVLADAVVASVRNPDGVLRTPYLRPGRRELLDPVADGLAYRTATLGLLRLETLRTLRFRYTEGGHSNGEDIEPALRLWFSGRRLTYPYGAPCYVARDDMGSARTTAVIGPIARELGFLPALLDEPWLGCAEPEAREAIAVKLARMQVVGGIARRRAHGIWSSADAECVSESTRRLARLSGNDLRALSAVETGVLEGAAGARDAAELNEAMAAADAGPRSGRVLPRDPMAGLRRAARPRIFVQQQLAARTGTYAHPSPPSGWLDALTGQERA